MDQDGSYKRRIRDLKDGQTGFVSVRSVVKSGKNYYINSSTELKESGSTHDSIEVQKSGSQLVLASTLLSFPFHDVIEVGLSQIIINPRFWLVKLQGITGIN